MEKMIIGIAGGSGSGKTTLAKNLARRFGKDCVILRHDNYYKSTSSLSIKERNELNYDSPDAFDTDILIENLDSLKRGESATAPIYDYTVHNRSSKTVSISPASIIIVEGILIFENEELRKRLDLKIFVDTDAETRLARRLERDASERGRSVQSVLSQYYSTVKPMHDVFVEPSKKFADIIIYGGGENPVTCDEIAKKVKFEIKKYNSFNFFHFS